MFFLPGGRDRNAYNLHTVSQVCLGQVKGVVFLALDTVVICKTPFNSESPVDASVQITVAALWNTLLHRPTNLLSGMIKPSHLSHQGQQSVG